MPVKLYIEILYHFMICLLYPPKHQGQDNVKKAVSQPLLQIMNEMNTKKGCVCPLYLNLASFKIQSDTRARALKNY